MRIWTFILTFLPLITVAQTDSEKLVDSLKYVKDMPYICETGIDFGCGDKIFWTVVKHKETVVPLLIDKLADTTTTLATVPNFGGEWTVGDISYTTLQEIINDIPTFDLLGVKFDKDGCGYCTYWNYLRKDTKNRKKFQTAVRNWYEMNKSNLVWVSSNEFLTCDCSGQHPNGGHFELKK